jgi:ABC-type transport system involved in multi-copper enzyme maturation permease subunit
MSQQLLAAATAVSNNDRDAALRHHLNFHQIYSHFWGSIVEAEYPLFTLGTYVYAELHEMERVRFEFAQLVTDNDIHFLYESEMKGFNFVYQAMRTILPVVLIFFSFLTICDVFAFGSEAGSYKLLLTQPFPRARIYFAKVIASFVILFVQFFTVLLAAFLIVSAVNGFGSPDYPVLMHTDAFVSLEPTPNRGYMGRLNFFYDFYNLRGRGFAYYPFDAFRLGVSHFNPSVRFHSVFTPHSSLDLYWMLTIILSALPLYAAILLLVAAISALVSVIFQSGVITIVIGIVLSITPLMFALPQTNSPFWQRLNPILYLHTISVLSGLGSTTALTGILTLAVFSAILLFIGVLVFRKKDIRC